jgi:hypothetical protein
MIMIDVQEELARLRQDMDQLKALLATGERESGPERPPQAEVNDAVVRHLKENLRGEGKTRGIAICRVVVIHDEHGTGVCSGLITSVNAADFQKPTKLRASVAALATDPLAIRAVRKLVEPFFDGQPMRMTRAELAAALDANEADVERSLLPLVADKMLTWSKTATGEEAYEIEGQEPHVLLIQSLE